MERDNEVKGNGNSYTSYWRQYDPRLGRWMSDEPKPVAWESGYAAFRNNPIIYTDPKGDYSKIGTFLRKVFGGTETFTPRFGASTTIKYKGIFGGVGKGLKSLASSSGPLGAKNMVNVGTSLSFGGSRDKREISGVSLTGDELYGTPLKGDPGTWSEENHQIWLQRRVKETNIYVGAFVDKVKFKKNKNGLSFEGITSTGLSISKYSSNTKGTLAVNYGVSAGPSYGPPRIEQDDNPGEDVTGGFGKNTGFSGVYAAAIFKVDISIIKDLFTASIIGAMTHTRTFGLDTTYGRESAASHISGVLKVGIGIKF